MKTTQHLLITGEVQGVGFRRFTERAAQALQLKGWVRNLHDGRVEVLVCGENSSLERFRGILKQGPPHAAVDAIECRDLGEDKDFEAQNDAFKVAMDGGKPWEKDQQII